MNHAMLSMEEYVLQRNDFMYRISAHSERHPSMYSGIDKNDIVTVLQNLCFHSVKKIKITQIINTLNKYKESISCVSDTILVLIQPQVQIAFSNK
jgi:hypothetical protein